MREWNVEVEFQGESFRTQVKAETPEEVTEIVLKSINVWVEDDEDPWDTIEEQAQEKAKEWTEGYE